MRISGTEPSSVILSQTVKFKKLKSGDQKLPKQAEAKWDGVINPKKLQFQTILTRKILMLSNATNQPKSTVELGYMCPRGLSGPRVMAKKVNVTYMDHMRISGTEPSSVILIQTN